jgi:hypothetical protein
MPGWEVTDAALHYTLCHIRICRHDHPAKAAASRRAARPLRFFMLITKLI